MGECEDLDVDVEPELLPIRLDRGCDGDVARGVVDVEVDAARRGCLPRLQAYRSDEAAAAAGGPGQGSSLPAHQGAGRRLRRPRPRWRGSSFPFRNLRQGGPLYRRERQLWHVPQIAPA